MQTKTLAPEKRYPAPVQSPNEFHLGPNDELINGLGDTQFPAHVKALTAQDLSDLADRELAIANAESVLEGKRAEAMLLIEQGQAELERDRAAFEKEKAAANRAKTAGR